MMLTHPSYLATGLFRFNVVCSNAAASLAMDDGFHDSIETLHRDIVVLARSHDGVHFLANRLTLERHDLPPPLGEGDLSFLDGHSAGGFVYDTVGVHEFLCVELFSKQVVRTDFGAFIQLQADDDSDLGVGIDELRWRFDCYALSWPLGHCGGKVEIDLVVFDMPWIGVYVLWSLPSIHSALGLPRASAGDWIYKSIQSWERRAILLGVPYGIRRSREYTTEKYDQTRPLDWPAACTHALLDLLLTWIYREAGGGGFRPERDKQKASELFSYLIAFLSYSFWRAYLS